MGININDFSFHALNTDSVAVLAVLILAGVLWCFFGLKMVRVWAAVLGLLTGFGVGAWVGTQFVSTQMAVLIIGAVVGIVFACVGAVFYRVGIFMVVCITGIFLAGLILSPSGMTMYLVCLGTGLAVALLTIAYAEPVTMVVTAWFGAVILGKAAGGFLPEAWYAKELVQYFIIFLIFVLGVWIQFLLESGKRKKLNLKKAKEIRKQHSAENEVEKARALMENLDDLPEEKQEEESDEEDDDDITYID